MANEIVTTAQDRMKQSLGSLQRDLGHIRAGRANASLLDRVQVVYYGAPTPQSISVNHNSRSTRIDGYSF